MRKSPLSAGTLWRGGECIYRVDVFSWFRQKRQGIRPASHEDLRVPLEAAPTFGLVVYCRLEGAGATLPDKSVLLRDAADWVTAHTEEPLRSGILDFLDQDLVNLFLHDRAEMPEPPDEILRAYNPGETEERRFRNATHAIVIGSPDLLVAPRIGLWSVIATARGIAQSLPGGVIVDPEFPRLLPLEQMSEDLPENGAIRVPDHILIPYSSDSRTGLLWITTKGMARFGLPEIEVRGAPPNLAASMMPVMNGLAQRLVNASMRLVGDSDGERETPDTLQIRSQFRFSVADIRLAYEDDDSPGDTDETDAVSTVRLELSEASRGDEGDSIGLHGSGGLGFLRLVPPHGVRADIGVYLNRLLTDLLGSDPQIESVETGDQAMEEAHEAALAEVPRVRARFQAGFRSGEVLHVKHGFPTDDEGHEYMWIAVTAWDDAQIRGVIANDPQFRRDLRAGQTIEIPADSVYDWMIAHTDGRVEGAYTNKALQERGHFDEPEM